MKRRKLTKRFVTLLLVFAIMVPYFASISLAADIVPVTDVIEGPTTIQIHLPGKSDIEPQWSVGGSSTVWVMTKYFSQGVHSISVNCSTSYSVNVYLTCGGSYWAGKDLTSSSPGPWYPRISTAGNYGIYVYNNANSAVDITLNVS